VVQESAAADLVNASEAEAVEAATEVENSP